MWKLVVVTVLRVGGIGGDFNSGRILGNVSFSLRRNRILSVVNSSNDKGAALLHYVGFLRATSYNAFSMSNGIVFGTSSGTGLSSGRVHGGELGFKLIFRSFGLFPRCDIFRGLILTPGLLTGRSPHCGASGGSVVRRVRRGTLALLRGIKLSSGGSTCPYRLSNKRGRHISVTETLYLSPEILFFSRPASTLSPRLANRVLGIVGDLTTSGVAVIVMARRVGFTRSISSYIVFVSDNIIYRRKAPRRIFRRPRRRHAGRFLRTCRGWCGYTMGGCGRKSFCNNWTWSKWKGHRIHWEKLGTREQLLPVPDSTGKKLWIRLREVRETGYES